jgi:hypothetical protein
MIIPSHLNTTITALLDNAVIPLTQDAKTAEQVLNEIQRVNPDFKRRVRPSLNNMRIKK